jgi:hypothetical protein
VNKEHFAKTFGFFNYEEMLESSTTVHHENNVGWYVTKLPHGKFLAWDNAEIADDRVEVFFTKEEAKDYLNILRDKAGTMQ